MTYFLKVADADVSYLNAEIAALPGLWDAHSFRRTAPGTPHSGMSDIWIRYNAFENLKAENPAAFNVEHDSVWYPAYYQLPALKDIIFPLMELVDGERLGGVLITRIPPGHGIDKHVDKSWHVDYYDKFYVSLQSQPGAKFFCGDEVLEPETGDIWRFDNRLEHWVRNESDKDRITLIICIRTEKFKMKESR